ncbi:MAG: peroxide stress protein YaaA [candidate division Zixibacteria bacterium]|nr:peroxide stress protein YaaA [candidate division Zixibacteria bacterium]
MCKSLILIPCCGSKQEGGDNNYDNDKSILNYLDDKSKLINLRKILLENFNLPNDLDVGDSPQNNNDVLYMPAYRRYCGKLYSKITDNAWQQLEGNPKLDLIIVSALFGLVKWNESLRDYNVAMKNKIEGKSLKRWWRDNNLCGILKDYIKENNISKIYNILSNDYSDALRGCFANCGIKVEKHNFSKYRIAINYHRGKWVNDFILKF